METTTTPQEVGESATPSLDDRIAAKFGLAESQEQEAPEPAAETAKPDDGELAPEDLQPDDEPQAQPDGEWLELDRKGEKRKVSREEARNLAQQGWDYSENQRALKEDREQFEQMKAAVTAKAQLHPKLIDAAADVRSFERALQQYGGVDWVRLAQDDPLGYQPAYAQFQALREGYQQAIGQWQQIANAAQQVDVAISDADTEAQFRLLYERAPELRDEARLKAEQGKVLAHLRAVGATQEQMKLVAGSAEAFLLIRDGLRYRQAVAAKRTQQMQKASPVIKPGVAQERQTAEGEYREKVKQLHQAKTPERKKALLDEVIAKKFGIK